MAIDITKLNRKQLDDLSRKVESRQTELHKDSIAKLRKRIEKEIKDAGFTVDDVFGRRGRGRTATRRGKVPPKFRNPADPTQTWSGRGKRPHWFKAALAKGKKEKDLLIK